MPSPRLLDYLRLLRVANVFTALSDVSMGVLFVAAATGQVVGLAWAIVALSSAMLYSAGMALNDAFDADLDARERPERPIPAGLIPRRRAFVIGFSLMAGGVMLACLAGTVAGGGWSWRTASIALLLAGAIVGYDSYFKRTPLGPPAMGSCRMLNILLGMSIPLLPEGESARWAGFAGPEWAVAVGLGVYIAGVTWFARTEADRSNRWSLSFALTTMVGGIALLASFPYFTSSGDRFGESITRFAPWLFGLVSLVVVRRCLDAIISPEPRRVQLAIKQSIMTLIIFDASICFAVAPSRPYYGILVLALLGPMIFLGRWISST